MWLITPLGFFSTVAKPGDSLLTVRARVASDLDALRSRYLPGLSATVAHAGTDYPFRARCTRTAWAEALGAMAHAIDYGNFKDEVARRQGHIRAKIYAGVWSQLTRLESMPVAASLPVSEPPRLPPGKALACGGVVMDAHGRVLLRLSRGRFDGEGWTWPKGRPNAGETPETCALREVREETGVVAALEHALPGLYEGSTSATRYWTMQALEVTGVFDEETEDVGWFTPEEARVRMQASTRSAVKLARDLAVLEAAVASFARGASGHRAW